MSFQSGAAKVTSLGLLSEPEARYWRDQVWARRQDWIPRLVSPETGEPTFFTLGRAVYLDVAQSDDPVSDYYQATAGSNEIIRRHFGDLLEKTRAILRQHLGAPVIYSEHLALPGFHIFLAGGVAAAAAHAPHLDMQYTLINWPARWDRGGPARWDSDKILSFTLALSLPRSGGGLDVWIERAAAPQAQSGAGSSQHEVVTEEYHEGFMCIQEGMLRHRIRATHRETAGDERVTLQGHGLRFSGTWVVYW